MGLSSFIPPVLIPGLKRLKHLIHPGVLEFSGDYEDFEAASEACAGGSWDSKVASQTEIKKVERLLGTQGSFELSDRDARLMSALLFALSRSPEKKLQVLDFGGGCGTHYATFVRLYGRDLVEKWTVIETGALVAEANQWWRAKSHPIEFLSQIPSHHSTQTPLTILTSGALQCVPEPYPTLEKLLSVAWHTLITDRVPLRRLGRDRCTVQTPLAKVIDTRFPAWFFDEALWNSKLASMKAKQAAEWIVKEDAPRLDAESEGTPYRGFIFVYDSPQ